MLCPEVSTFNVPQPWKRYDYGCNVKEECSSQGFKRCNEVIESVKIFLPECLHPPDNLKNILLHDKDYYLIEHLKSLECCATDDFIKSFICAGSLFLRTIYGKLLPKLL